MENTKKEERKTVLLMMLEAFTVYHLVQSMRQSKVLTAMVVIGLLSVGGFFFFLRKMTGA